MSAKLILLVVAVANAYMSPPFGGGYGDNSYNNPSPSYGGNSNYQPNSNYNNYQPNSNYNSMNPYSGSQSQPPYGGGCQCAGVGSPPYGGGQSQPNFGGGMLPLQLPFPPSQPPQFGAGGGMPQTPVFVFGNGRSKAWSTSSFPTQDTPGYWPEGMAFCLSPYSDGALNQPIWIYRKDDTGDSFMTANANEIGTTQIGAHGKWNYRVIEMAGYVSPNPQEGLVPIHRWWSGSAGFHFFSLDRNEADRMNMGYNYEGVAGYVYPCQS
jgi:hypothetical protein